MSATDQPAPADHDLQQDPYAWQPVCGTFSLCDQCGHPASEHVGNECPAPEGCACGSATCRAAGPHWPPDPTPTLPPHIRHYVHRIRPSLWGDQRVVEFEPGGIAAIDERDVLQLAAALLDVPLDRILSA